MIGLYAYKNMIRIIKIVNVFIIWMQKMFICKRDLLKVQVKDNIK